MKTSRKNQSKIDPKSTNNLPKIDLGGVLGASWKHLGTLDAPKTVFFALLVGLGCVLWATRGQHGRNLGPKMDPKTHQNRCQN